VMKPLHISVELMMARIGIVTGAASFSIGRGIALHLAEVSGVRGTIRKLQVTLVFLFSGWSRCWY
jgi:hypothetical protein